jgi:flagellar assembly factor FliW
MTMTTVDVEFVSALPGLAPHTAFTLDRIDGAQGLHALHAVEGSVRLFLLDSQSVGQGYRPPIARGILAEIGAGDESEVRVFVVVNPAEDGIYLNLRAPIVVHRSTGRAVQIILEDQSYPVRALLGSWSAMPDHAL